MTQVDHDAFTAFAPLLPVLETYVLTPTPGGVRSERAPSLEQAIREALGREVRMIHGDDPVTAEREQWDEGNNVLALSPGTVLAYERNRATNDCLRAAGIEVIEIPGTELNRGRGGARCLTCPIERAPA
jgi:arginine deiminase